MSKLEKGDLCVVVYMDEHEEIWEVIDEIVEKDGYTIYQLFSAVLETELWEEPEDLILVAKASGAQKYLNHYYNEVLPYKKKQKKKQNPVTKNPVKPLSSPVKDKTSKKAKSKIKIPVEYRNTVDGQLDRLNDLYSKLTFYDQLDERFIELSNEIEQVKTKISKLSKLV